MLPRWMNASKLVGWLALHCRFWEVVESDGGGYALGRRSHFQKLRGMLKVMLLLLLFDPLPHSANHWSSHKKTLSR